MKKFASMRKGFTLIELLIVIVVIGILSAMMMLSSSETISTAKATVIIANMRNLKTAALAYFADNPDYIYSTPANKTSDISNNLNSSKKNEWEALMGYLNGKDYPSEKSYKLITSYNGTAWYVECSLSGKDTGKDGDKATPLLSGSELEAVKKKLAGRAKSVGLLADRFNESDARRVYFHACAVDNNFSLYEYISLPCLSLFIGRGIFYIVT